MATQGIGRMQAVEMWANTNLRAVGGFRGVVGGIALAFAAIATVGALALASRFGINRVISKEAAIAMVATGGGGLAAGAAIGVKSCCDRRRASQATPQQAQPTPQQHVTTSYREPTKLVNSSEYDQMIRKANGEMRNYPVDKTSKSSSYDQMIRHANDKIAEAFKQPAAIKTLDQPSQTLKADAVVLKPLTKEEEENWGTHLA